MKKSFFSFLILLMAFGVSACSTTTITEKPGDYLYGINEPIKIIDIDTRDELGTITITGAEILLDYRFQADSWTGGRDENGEKTYKNELFYQIVQVFFQHDFETAFDKSNFVVSDDAGGVGTGIDNLKNLPTFEEKTKADNKSFIVVLSKKSDFIKIKFLYSSMQAKPTARIKIDLQ